LQEINKPKIGFIGAGITGTALSIRLAQEGYRVTAISSCSLASATKLASMMQECQICKTAQKVADTADLIFVTTPDDAIPGVVGDVWWHKGQSIVHCSGAHSVGILELAKKYGANTGCFHPLQTFASARQAMDNLPGSLFAIEAEEPLLSALKDMAVALKGSWIILKPGDKVLYHAAAVFSSNYLVTLLDVATGLWEKFGVSEKESIRALMPLIRGTLGNIENVGLPNCLTGPIARGDLGTIKSHLRELEKKAPHFISIYRELGKQTVPIAWRKGKIDRQRVQELQDLLTEPKKGKQ